MSNHSGSYMLNEVLYVANNMGIFEKIGKEESIKFTKKLIGIGNRHDCNNYEILEDFGRKLGICWNCLHEIDDLESGFCKECGTEV